jgi:hypothetical protein
MPPRIVDDFLARFGIKEIEKSAIRFANLTDTNTHSSKQQVAANAWPFEAQTKNNVIIPLSGQCCTVPCLAVDLGSQFTSIDWALPLKHHPQEPSTLWFKNK